MSEEPTTPPERAVFIVGRISAAMRDFERMHPKLPARPVAREDLSLLGAWTPARYEALGGYTWRIVPAHYEPASEVLWSLDTPHTRRAALELAGALAGYVEGWLDIPGVKASYQEFASAHLVYWLEGRMFTDKGAAYLAVVEKLHEHYRVSAQASYTAPVAHPVERAPQPKTRPRLAYSRGRGKVGD